MDDNQLQAIIALIRAMPPLPKEMPDRGLWWAHWSKILVFIATGKAPEGV